MSAVVKIVAHAPLPLVLDEAAALLRQQGLEVVIEDAAALELQPATLASECDLLLFDAARHGDWIAPLRADVDAATLPVAVWAEASAGRAALQAGADIWLSVDETAADLALRLIALARRAHLGGAPRLDPLTGLIGYRRLQQQLRHEFDRAVRYKRSLALVVIEPDDLDETPRGRRLDSGDALLKDLARQLRRLVRDVDLLGRLAGKRFAVVLPETDGAGAVAAAERLRVAIDPTSFSAAAAHPSARGTGPGPLTVSIGVSALPARGMETPADLLGRALESMVQAQRRGGNRVIAFGAPEFIWSRQAPDPSQL